MKRSNRDNNLEQNLKINCSLKNLLNMNFKIHKLILFLRVLTVRKNILQNLIGACFQ